MAGNGFDETLAALLHDTALPVRPRDYWAPSDEPLSVPLDHGSQMVVHRTNLSVNNAHKFPVEFTQGPVN